MWGAICDYSWDSRDAAVACKQLGFGNASETYCCSSFSGTVKRVWLRHVYCSGNESSIAQCPSSGYNSTGTCSSHSYAGVRCIGTMIIILCDFIVIENSELLKILFVL